MTLRASRRTELIRRMRAPRAFQSDPAAPVFRGPATKGFSIHTALQVGKYLVSPLIRRDDGGRYTASVSIRSGRGSMTHDRVMRFVPVFASREQAARFATSQALTWIGQRAPAQAPSTFTLE
ncbi:hypothetical protein [Methylibium rhizosphaerae]|uniref:hypothetical protein n=1 Tax=Methylibium rhizosphaerae TaxID=2570323 RepID=UPI003CCC47EB